VALVGAYPCKEQRCQEAGEPRCRREEKAGAYSRRPFRGESASAGSAPQSRAGSLTFDSRGRKYQGGLIGEHGFERQTRLVGCSLYDVEEKVGTDTTEQNPTRERCCDIVDLGRSEGQKMIEGDSRVGERFCSEKYYGLVVCWSLLASLDGESERDEAAGLGNTDAMLTASAVTPRQRSLSLNPSLLHVR
jgi:hypothetical protein